MKRSRNMELKVHIDAKPHWSLDDTLQEVKSIVTLIENRIPQVPLWMWSFTSLNPNL